MKFGGNHLATATNIFKDNRVSEEWENLAERYTLQEYSNRLKP